MSGPTSLFVTAPDGLKLHVRDYGPHSGPRLPAICLPGLARSGADFETLAGALAEDRAAPRRIIALDSRGRGRSDYDPDPTKYTLAVELGDLLCVLDTFGIGRAVFVGTSRGGILTMLLAAVRPAVIAGCVLNDIGPVIELTGLLRIKGYVGKLPQPASWQDAAAILRNVFGAQFPLLTESDWLAWAKRSYKEANGRLAPDYDIRLSNSLEAVTPENPLPAMWEQFNALAAAAPVLVIRGANSDLLSTATVAAMQAGRPAVEAFEVGGQGHAPLLMEADVIGQIAAFLAACDLHDRR